MSSKENLIGALQQFSEQQGIKRRESMFVVIEMQNEMEKIQTEIASWFSGMSDIGIELAPMPQMDFRGSAFNGKQLRINVANFQVTINPILRYEKLFFNVVGLSDRDLLMNANYQMTDWNESPVGSLSADFMYQRLTQLVGAAG